MKLDDWWKLYDKNFDALAAMVLVYHPGNHHTTSGNMTEFDGEITAPNAEAARRHVIESQQYSPVSINDLKEIRNEGNHERMRSILNSTWFGIPESRSLVQDMGVSFLVLCGLCSECEG